MSMRTSTLAVCTRPNFRRFVPLRFCVAKIWPGTRLAHSWSRCEVIWDQWMAARWCGDGTTSSTVVLSCAVIHPLLALLCRNCRKCSKFRQAIVYWQYLPSDSDCTSMLLLHLTVRGQGLTKQSVVFTKLHFSPGGQPPLLMSHEP